ncbi:uncharacterized protein BDR25DRAFT_209767, partial [Lindgomyces ingoldianus]
IVNNTISTEWQYIREIANCYNKAPLLSSLPVRSPNDPAIVCGSDANAHPQIETATIIAGDEVGFMVSPPWTEFDWQTVIWHPGPGQIFLSKSPTENISAYDGSGDWFKIGYAGPENSTTWSLLGKYGMNVTIPRMTPPGKYLMRFEQFQPGPEFGDTPFFVACAHVEILGRGRGRVGRRHLVRFPGAYNISEPSTSILFLSCCDGSS